MIKIAGNTTIPISHGDQDWWSNDKKYQWGPFNGQGSYEVNIYKTSERNLLIYLKVPGADWVKVESSIAEPKNGELRVSITWSPLGGYTFAQNGRKIQDLPPANPE